MTPDAHTVFVDVLHDGVVPVWAASLLGATAVSQSGPEQAVAEVLAQLRAAGRLADDCSLDVSYRGGSTSALSPDRPGDRAEPGAFGGS